MIDSQRLLDTFLTILRIDSYYPNEDPVIDALRPKLERAGVRLRADAHRNVLGFWPGSGERGDEEPILLCAHTDTVRPTPGMEPVIRDGAVHTDGSSVLGADDKAAVAAIVEAVEAIADDGTPHPPVEVLFTVGEDVGHIGSKAFDVAEVRSRMAFVPDVDGPVGGIIMAGPTAESFRVTFHGRAAHAGTEPEEGRSALQMASRAIDRMQLGRIDGETTANAGVLTGGEAANIIPPDASLTLQVRSLDQGKFRAHRAALVECCRQGAEAFAGSIAVESLGHARLPVRRGRPFGPARRGGDPFGGACALARHHLRRQRRQRVQRQGAAHRGDLGRLPGHPHQPGVDADRRAGPLAEVCRALMLGYGSRSRSEDLQTHVHLPLRHAPAPLAAGLQQGAGRTDGASPAGARVQVGDLLRRPGLCQERQRHLHAQSGGAERGVREVLGEDQHIPRPRRQQDVGHLLRGQPPRPEVVARIAVADRQEVVGRFAPAVVDHAQVVAVGSGEHPQTAVVRPQIVQVQRDLDVRDRPGDRAAAAVPGRVAVVPRTGRALVEEVVAQQLVGDVVQAVVVQQAGVTLALLAEVRDARNGRPVPAGVLREGELLAFGAQRLGLRGRAGRAAPGTRTR